ncbi:MAG: phosphotransferase [Thermodesulfobacteriota bacterium]
MSSTNDLRADADLNLVPDAGAGGEGDLAGIEQERLASYIIPAKIKKKPRADDLLLEPAKDDSGGGEKGDQLVHGPMATKTLAAMRAALAITALDKGQDGEGLTVIPDKAETDKFLKRFRLFLGREYAVVGRGLNLAEAEIGRGSDKNGYYPADVTFKALVRDNHNRPAAFLLCANLAGKDLVWRNVVNARRIKNILSGRLSEAVTVPFCDGHFEGVSWAMYDLHRPLANSGLQWFMQRTMIAPYLAKWLEESLQETKRETSPERREEWLAALISLIADSKTFAEIRQVAAGALAKMQRDELSLHTALSHNDLWRGNVMLPFDDTGKFGSFALIDWAGATTTGVPFFDLLKLCQSFRVPKFHSRMYIKRHCQILNCPVADSLYYLVLALAVLGSNLGQFPRHAYLRLCKDLFMRHRSYIT